MSEEVKELTPWMNALVKAKDKFNEINRIHGFVNYDKECMFAMQSIKNNDYLMNIANNNPSSLRDAVINIAAIGLSLNPAEKLAYLVPRNKKACLDISYIGLIKLATDTGSIAWARAELVHENDELVYKGATEKPEITVPNPFSRGEVKGVYCVAKTCDGDYLAGIMSIDEINDIRDRSEAGKKGVGPWVTDYGEMAKKTIIKRESKTWPKTDKSGRFDDAIQYLNDNNEEGIEFQQINPDPIDIQKIEEAYIKTIELIDADNWDEDAETLREMYNLLTQDEQLRLNSKLQKYKPGPRQYNTVFKDMLNHYPDEPQLPAHMVE